MMTGNEMAALIKLFGSEEKARQWLEQNVDATNRAIEAAGMITRSSETPTARPQAQDDPQGEPGQGQAQEPAAVEVDEALLSEIVKRATESESFTGFGEQLNEVVTAIETLTRMADTLATQVETLQKDVTERLAKLERGKTQERQEWVNDLPAKPTVTRVSLKPRFAQEPEETEQTSTDRANNTLAKLPAH